MRSPTAAGILAIGVSLALPAGSRAEEWSILGSKSMGMGGAGVASTRGGAATYWNPAALARSEGERGTSGRTPDKEHPSFDVSGGFSPVIAAPGDLLRNLDNLRDDIDALDFTSFQSKLNSGAGLSQDDLRRSLRILGRDLPALDQKGQGVLVDAIGGPMVRIKRLGLAALATVHAGATSRVDFENIGFGSQGITTVLGSGQDRSGQLTPSGQSLANAISGGGSMTQDQAEELVFQAEAGGVDTADPAARRTLEQAATATAAAAGGGNSKSIADNRSGSDVRGLFLQEIAAGYGLPLGDLLALGLAAKGMHGFAYSKNFRLADLPETSELATDVIHLNDMEGSFNIGIDAGALLTPTDWLALGITGKNLNRPAFDREGGGHFVLDPNARAGVALHPLRWLEVAADLDLFVNHSDVLPGFRSQTLGGGAQVDLGIVALRAGISKNLADSTEDVLLHAGVALRIFKFSLEAAAMATPSLRTIDSGGDAKVPERAGFSLTLGLNIAF